MAINLNDSEDGIISEINMTPLIDIMLVLLIIFMVTSTVALESGLDIDIPKTKSKTTLKNNKAVIISINKPGVIFVQGKQTDYSKLKDDIGSALKLDKTDVVIFEGDTKTQLGIAIKIMDIAKSAGAKSFSIAAEAQN